MNINPTVNVNFSSKNATIRFADNIARKVNQEFPRISVTRVESFKNADKFNQLLENLWSLTHLMREIMKRRFVNSKGGVEKIKNLLNTVKENQLGNCKESAQLAIIASKLNGLKLSKIAYVVSPDDHDYDHAVVLVDNYKNPYVIDAWLGFADYVPKAIERYQKDFRGCFDFEEAGTEKMKITEDFGLMQYFLNHQIHPEDIKDVKKLYPDLVLKDK